jgi:hypothetical protein
MDSTSTCIDCGQEKVTAIRTSIGIVVLALFCGLYYKCCLADLVQGEPLLEQSREDTDQTRGCLRSAAAAVACLMNVKAVQLCSRPFRYLARKFAALIIFILSRFLQHHGTEIIKILISFAQVSGTFATKYSVQWPSALANFLHAMAFFNVTLRALPGNLACSMTGISYRQLQYAYLFTPIVILVLLSLPAAVVSLRREHPKYEPVMKRLAANCCFVLFLLYPIVSGPALENQTCIEIGGGEERLKGFLEEPCHPKEGSSTEFALGVALVVIYPIGGLIMLAFLLWYYNIPKMARHKIEEAHLHSLLDFYKRVLSKTISAKIAHEVGGASSLLRSSTSASAGTLQ